MEVYQLDYVLHEPSEEQGWLYMAEIPELPGCPGMGRNGKQDSDRTIDGGGAVHPLLPGPGEGLA